MILERVRMTFSSSNACPEKVREFFRVVYFAGFLMAMFAPGATSLYFFLYCASS